MSSLWRPIKVKNKPPYSKTSYYIRYDYFTIRKVTVKKLSQNTVSHRTYTPGNTVIWHLYCTISEGSSCITFINSDWTQNKKLKKIIPENFDSKIIAPNSIPKMRNFEPILAKNHQKRPILTQKCAISSRKSHKTVKSVIQRIVKCQ